MKRKILGILVCLMIVPLAIGLAACGKKDNGGGEDPKPSVTSVTVSPKTHTFTEAGTKQLTATVAVKDGAAATVTWTSSNSAVATVSATGLVTAALNGTTTITATSTADTTKSDTATITVNISGNSVAPTALELFMTALATGSYYTEETDDRVWGESSQLTTAEYIRRSYYYVAQDGTEWVKNINICGNNHPYKTELEGRVEWKNMTDLIRYSSYDDGTNWRKEAMTADGDNGPGMSQVFGMLEDSWVAVAGGYEIIIANLDNNNPLKAMATAEGMAKVTLTITVSDGVATSGIMKTFGANGAEKPMGFNVYFGAFDLATELASLATAFANATQN